MGVSVVIKEVRRETRDCFTLVFENHNAFSNYQSGQFINIACIINGKAVNRSYSLSSSPFQGELPAITIKRVKGGLMSNYLWKTAKKGDTLHSSLPVGRFVSEYSPESKNVLMIAGGSGITPIFSILKSTLIRNPKAQITLLYSSKEPNQVIFDNNLRVLQKMYAHRLNISYFITEGGLTDLSTEIQHVFGRIKENHLRDFMNKNAVDPRKIDVFICGPEELMTSCHSSLIQLGLLENQILTECFTLNSVGENKSDQLLATSSVTVKRNGDKEFSFEALKSQPILLTGKALGYQMPHSCLAAMCGTCKARVLQGKVKMSQNYALSDSELKEGYVLLCSGIPETGVVELAYD